MAKLILHVFVAVLLWVGLAALGMPVWIRVGALLGGAVAVHLVWDRLLFPDFLSPGSIPVADDDPLMLEALAKARATMAQFLRLYPDHQTDSIVKFLLVTDSGVKESVWADLVEIIGNDARVYIRTPPVHQTAPLERARTVPVAEIIDWQIEFRDGTLRGGFTNQALFRVFERENGYLPASIIPHISRFKDLESDDARQGA